MRQAILHREELELMSVAAPPPVLEERQGWMTVRVVERTMTACDVVSLRLVPVEGALSHAEPGAHIDVEAAPGLIRQYSLVNPRGPASEYTIGVKLETNSRGGSKAVHERMHVGALLRVSRPRNNFPLRDGPGHSVLIAGGIGVTPLLSMARSLHAERRSFVLHYFARSSQHAAFVDLLRDLGNACELRLGLDGAETAAAVASLLGKRSAGDRVYSCGPAPMLELVRKAAAELGWPQDRVHFEYFAAPADAVAKDPDSSFDVVLAKRGMTVHVPAGVSIVAALRQNGVEIETSCEQGICSTCLTGVLGGIPDHRDYCLDASEKAAGKQMLLCVSRSKSATLVLDL